jgi:hypothetical protein
MISPGSPETLECIACLLIGDLRVDLHRDLGVGVPQDLHGDSWVHVQIGKQGSTTTPGIVHSDPSCARLLASTIAEPKKVAWLDRSSEFRRDDQSVVVPRRPGLRLGGFLRLVMALQCCDAYRR